MFYLSKEDKAKKAVKSFLKAVKYNVSFESIEDFLKTQGFGLIAFNTKKGDAEIEKHSLQNMTTERAFTYAGESRLVFVDVTLHPRDKILILLHEVAHVIFEHVGINKHFTRDEVKAEIEADAFAYGVLVHKRARVQTF